MNKKGWFKKLGLLLIPVNWKGFFITGFIIIFCINIFLVVDANSSSIKDTLFGISPYIGVALIAFYLIALKTSKPRK